MPRINAAARRTPRSKRARPSGGQALAGHDHDGALSVMDALPLTEPSRSPAKPPRPREPDEQVGVAGGVEQGDGSPAFDQLARDLKLGRADLALSTDAERTSLAAAST